MSERAPLGGNAGVPRLIYIVGAGRSGSTILAALLGSAPKVVAMGELFAAGTEQGPCSCGALHCEVWAAVDRLQIGDWRRWSRHHAVLPVFWGFPLGAFADETRAVLQTIAKITGARVVVDSSKYAARGLALHRVLGGEVQFIWLQRDPAGLLQSWTTPHEGTEQPPRSVGAVVAYDLMVALSVRLLRRRVNVHFVSYEQLCEDPAEVLARLGRAVDLDLSDVVELADQPIGCGHMRTANRIRKAGIVQLGPAIAGPDSRAARWMRRARRLVG